MNFLRRNWRILLIIFLLIVAGYVFYVDSIRTSEDLTFALVDVGQGDAIFIQSPTGTQVLIDAGPPRQILGRLANLMPPFDRSLDAIIITHPDYDHIGGFSEVLRNYRVEMFIEPGSYNDSHTYKDLKEEVKNKGIEEILAQRGMVLDLGGGAELHILFPDRDVSSWVTNDASVVAMLHHGENTFMLTGDSTKQTEEIILSYGDELDSDVLKVGHHGSKTSTSEEFLKATKPEYALISAGKDNRYGHPAQEVVDRLENIGANILGTYEEGTIIFKSDGENLEF